MVKNILLIGKTGSGKSTLANVLTNSNEFKESSGSISETREIKVKVFSLDEKEYRIIDTVGIGDTKLSKEEVLDKIAEAVYLAREGIHQILFVVSGRLDVEEIAIYNVLKKTIFDDHSTNHTSIIRTRFNDFDDKEKIKKDIEEIINQDQISNISYECQNRFIHINNREINRSCVKCGKDRNFPCNRCNLFIKNSTNIRSSCREIIFNHLKSLENKSKYLPHKLFSLSREIEEFIENDLKLKENLEKELEKVRITQKRRSSIEKSSIGEIQEENNEEDLNDNPFSLSSEIEVIEDEKVNLEKLIEENRLKIREKVYLHVFNNCKPDSLGEKILIDKIDEELNEWVKWIQLKTFGESDYGFCAWLKKIKEYSLNEVKNFNLQKIRCLKKEYSQGLKKEREVYKNFITLQNKTLVESEKVSMEVEDALETSFLFDFVDLQNETEIPLFSDDFELFPKIADLSSLSINMREGFLGGNSTKDQELISKNINLESDLGFLQWEPFKESKITGRENLTRLPHYSYPSPIIRNSGKNQRRTEKSEENQQIFQCDKCPKTFERRYNFVQHHKTHSEIKEFRCDFLGCDSAFHRRTDLQRHRLRHTGELPIECPFCNARFRRVEAQKRHCQQEHREAYQTLLEQKRLQKELRKIKKEKEISNQVQIPPKK